MRRTLLVAPLLALVALGAAAAGLVAAAPERTIPHPFGERVASGAAALIMRGIAAGYAAPDGGAPLGGAPVLVHVTFRAEGDLDAFAARMDGFAPFLSNVPGLAWKVWALDPQTRAGSGTYLFETRGDADLYLAEILPEGMGNVPTIADMTVSITPVMPGPSRLTRAVLTAGGEA